MYKHVMQWVIPHLLSRTTSHSRTIQRLCCMGREAWNHPNADLAPLFFIFIGLHVYWLYLVSAKILEEMIYFNFKHNNLGFLFGTLEF